MHIQLNMEPSMVPMEWADFLKTKPPFSVALDGYVKDGPEYDDDGPYHNFNHHEGVKRMETRSTCAQVRLAISTGMYSRFCDDDGPRVNIYANDCDQDVCTAVFQLRHPQHVSGVISSRLNRLVYLEDILDTTGGAYPFPEDLHDLRRVAWIYQPYTSFRMGGELERNKDPDAYVGVVDAVCERIQQYLDGRGRDTDLDTRFDILPGGGPGWSMVREIGAQARTGLFAQGIRAFVSVREGPGDAYTYAFCKMVPYVKGFKLPSIFKALNLLEPKGRGLWGGGNITGGSPKPHGSLQKPDEVARAVELSRWG